MIGLGDRTRTCGLTLPKRELYQLSYTQFGRSREGNVLHSGRIINLKTAVANVFDICLILILQRPRFKRGVLPLSGCVSHHTDAANWLPWLDLNQRSLGYGPSEITELLHTAELVLPVPTVPNGYGVLRVLTSLAARQRVDGSAHF
jgi:hypothetical protein